MKHSVVAMTGRDGKEQPRRLAADSHERRAAAAPLTPGQAVALWYRMGLLAPHLRPPRRFRYAYDLGRKTAALKDPAHTAALPQGCAG